MPKLVVASSKERRKGQLTVFIVVSVVLVFLIAFLYNRVVLTEQRVTEFAKTSQQWDVQSIETFVQGCVNKLSTDSVFYFGMVGGRTGFFPEYLSYDEYYKIPYYYSYMASPSSSMPSKDQIEKDILSTYVASRLKGCTDGFKSVQGFQIVEGEPRVKAVINQKTVDFTVEYPIEISKGDQVTRLKEFSYRQPSRLYDMINFAKDIVDAEVDDDKVIYWDYLTAVTEMGFNMTAHSELVHTVVYRIVDPAPENRIYFEPYVFQFANRVRVQG